MLTYKIHLIRSGSTSDGTWKRYVGQTDLPLCAKGAEALHALKRKFRYPEVDMVFTSPLLRCVQTAELLYPDAFTERINDFQDMNLGGFEGKTVEELRGSEPFELWMKDSARYAPPGGEGTEAFCMRVIDAIGTVFTHMMTKRMTSVAVVTHAGVIMTLLTSIGLPRLPLHEWTVNNGCGFTLLMTPQMWMRDRSCEVWSRQPEPSFEDASDSYGLYDIG